MRTRTLSAVFPIVALALLGCQASSAPGQSGAIHFDPPNTQFAARLNIAPPITEDQARAIAAEAAQGTAVSVSQETEGGELLYEVKVDTASGRMEVEVRASDGGVVEIEPDDGD